MQDESWQIDGRRDAEDHLVLLGGIRRYIFGWFLTFSTLVLLSQKVYLPASLFSTLYLSRSYYCK